MHMQELTDHLSSDELLSSLKEISESEHIDSSIASLAITWTLGLRDDFLGVIKEIEDGSEDLDMSLAVFYIELKSKWISFNTRMNYQMFKGGSVDQSILVRGSTISCLLMHIESKIDTTALETINSFLAEPLSGRKAA